MYPTCPADLHAQPLAPQRRHALGSSTPWSAGSVPNLDPHSGLSGPSVLLKVLVEHPATEIGSSDPC